MNMQWIYFAELIGMFANKLPNPGWEAFAIGFLGLTEAEVSQEQGVIVGGLGETCWKSACVAGIDTTYAIHQLENNGEDLSEAFDG